MNPPRLEMDCIKNYITKIAVVWVLKEVAQSQMTSKYNLYQNI